MNKKIKILLGKKRAGLDQALLSLGGIILVILLTFYLVGSRFVINMHHQLEDALVSAELAAATTEIGEYGRTHLNKTKSLNIFKEYIMQNLEIEQIVTDPIIITDELFVNGDLGNQMRLIELTIYDVQQGRDKQLIIPSEEGLSEIVIPAEGGSITKYTYKNGQWLPDEVLVSQESYNPDAPPLTYTIPELDSTIYETSIYCKVEIPMKTFFGVKGIAAKEQLVSVQETAP